MPIGEYKTGLVWKGLTLIVFGALFVGSVWYCGVSFYNARYNGREIASATYFAFGAVFSAYVILYTLNYRITLFPDAIEVRGFFRTRRVLKQNIIFKKDMFGGLMLMDCVRTRPLSINTIFRTDEFFWNWMNSIPYENPDLRQTRMARYRAQKRQRDSG